MPTLAWPFRREKIIDQRCQVAPKFLGHAERAAFQQPAFDPGKFRERFHLGDFHINDMSSDGIGEIGINDLDAAATDKSSLGAQRLAVGDIRFPDISYLSNALRAAEAGEAAREARQARLTR